MLYISTMIWSFRYIHARLAQNQYASFIFPGVCMKTQLQVTNGLFFKPLEQSYPCSWKAIYVRKLRNAFLSFSMISCQELMGECTRRELYWKKNHPIRLCLKNLFLPTHFSFLLRVSCRICHVLAVQRLRWRRKRDFDDSSCFKSPLCPMGFFTLMKGSARHVCTFFNAHWYF